MDDKNEKFFQLLRYSIGASEEAPVIISDEEWNDIYEMAIRQSISGLLLQGIQMGGLKPPIYVKVKWMVDSEIIKDDNLRANKAAVLVVKSLKRNGFDCCILKGRGNSLFYPNVYSRVSGDIDVWVMPKERRGQKEDVKRVIRFVKERNPKAKVIYYHIKGGKCNGVEVEMHYRPSFMNNPIHNRRLQKWFIAQSEEQFQHEVEMPDDVGKIAVPTIGFNVVYLLSHTYKHLLQDGVRWGQVIDYFFLLRKAKDEWKMENREMRIMLRYLGLWKIAGAMMWVLKEVLGMDEKYLIVPPNEKLGVFLLDEIMQGGNFGRYDVRTKHSASRLSRNIERLQRDVRLVWYFPSECLWEPVFRIYHFIWRLPYR